MSYPLLLLLLISSTVFGLLRTPANSSPFMTFKHKLKRQYLSAEEESYRAAVFEENYRQIEAINAESDSVQLEVNMFSDWTDEEFAKYKTNQRSTEGGKRLGLLHSCDTPWTLEPGENVEINWLDEGVVAPVKDQAMCGSCWTFSAAEAVESAYAIRNGEVIIMAEQELVDCIHAVDSNGCNGGYMTRAFDYIKENGIAREKDYPYMALDMTCKKDETPRMFPISGHQNVTNCSATELMDALKSQPVAVELFSSTFYFKFYKSGVVPYDKCDWKDTDHDVLLVGAGVEDGVPYWLLQNSWGPNWGNNGLVKIYRHTGWGPDTCGVNLLASFPIAAGSEEMEIREQRNRI